MADLTADPRDSAPLRGVRVVVRHPSVRTYAGKSLDSGQLFMLRGLENDDRLVRLGFVERVPKGGETFPCRSCGAPFASLRALNDHGRQRHLAAETLVYQAPKAADADKVTDQSFIGTEPDNDPSEAKDTPQLYLDQTAAARGVKPGPITL